VKTSVIVKVFMFVLAIAGVPISMRAVTLISAPLPPSVQDYVIGYAATITLAFFVMAFLPKFLGQR